MSKVRNGGKDSPSAIPFRFMHCMALMALVLFAVPSQGRAAATATPAMNISSGFESDGGYGRIILGFPKNIPSFTKSVNAGVLLLTFDRPVSLDLTSFSRKLPEYVAAVRQDADGKTLRVALAGSFRLNTLQAENKLYLDLLPADWSGEAPPLPADVVARRAAAEEARKLAAEEALHRKREADMRDTALTVRAARMEGVTRLSFDWNMAVKYSLSRKGDVATLVFDRPAKVALAALRIDPPPFLSSISAVERQGRLSIDMKLADDVVIKDFREDMSIVLDLKSTHKDKAEETEAKKPDPLKLGMLPGRDETTYIFPWKEQVGAAVFMRGQNLWVVFDRSAEFDLSEAEKLVKKTALPEISAGEGGMAFIFPLEGSQTMVGAAQEGTTWRISVGNTEGNPGRAIALSRYWMEGTRGAVSLDLRNASKIVEMKDPDAGSMLLVATAPGPAQSVREIHDFIEFEALQTAHGVAISRVADDVDVHVGPNAVTVTRADGLALSNGSPEEERQQARAAAHSPALMDFKSWGGGLDFTAGRKMHLAGIAAQPADSHDAGPRVAYAKFLLANGLGPEALIQLDLAEKMDASLLSTPSFNALKGVAKYKSYRYAEAAFDLSGGALAMDANAAVWRGLSRSALGQFEGARADFRIASAALGTVPPELASQVRIEAARAALAGGNADAAIAYIAQLPKQGLPHFLSQKLAIVQAGILDRQDKMKEAVEAYDQVAARADPEIAVQARLRKSLMLNRMKRISDDQLIADLNQLRMQWRGGEIERMILSKLAKMQLAKGDVPQALLAMRYVTLGFPDNDDARAIGAKMPDIFADYFMNTASEKLKPVDALAFYYTYQSLTPIGEKGDRLIRSLADRLVSVDLLPQAAALLRYQIDNRLHGGIARAQVATSLAKIHLLDGKPQDALDALSATAQNLLPDEIDEERRLLQARSFAALKKYAVALDLLGDLPGEAARKLESDVLWEAKDWGRAGASAEGVATRSVKDAGKLPGELDEEQRFHVMRSAIAYALARDDQSLARLRGKFAAAMKATPDEEGFDVVSDPIAVSTPAFSEFVVRIASVDTIERFIHSLKQPDRLASAATNSVN